MKPHQIQTRRGMLDSTIARAVGPSDFLFARIHGALPHAGMDAGLWPLGRSAVAFLPRQRRTAIPAWGNAPGNRRHNKIRAESPNHLWTHTKFKIGAACWIQRWRGPLALRIFC